MLTASKTFYREYFGENLNVIFQFILAIFFLCMGIWFIKNERSELGEVRAVLTTSGLPLVLLGMAVTLFYLISNALMYMAAFRTVGSKILFSDAIILFLKRNFVSVFLPAGGVTSLAFFSASVEKKGINKSQINFASSIYGFLGLFSVVLIAVPVFLYTLFKGSRDIGQWWALVGVIALSFFVYLFYHSVKNKGTLYRILIKTTPSLRPIADDIAENVIKNKFLLYTTFCSVLVDLLGVAHLYIAMKAFSLNPTLYIAFFGYVVAVIFMIISPFLRGLGARWNSR
mgnify:CR=1 FL=1